SLRRASAPRRTAWRGRGSRRHLAGFVDRADAGVLEPRERGGLALERERALGGGRKAGWERLERDASRLTRVVGEVHAGLAAAADLADEPVGAEEARGALGGCARCV